MTPCIIIITLLLWKNQFAGKMKKDIIIKSFNGIGDALFMTPSLRVIKESYPDSFITVNTNRPALFVDNPYVDVIGFRNEGVFLGYADPIHCKNPTKHHIIADWEIICKAYDLKTRTPELKPEIYFPLKEVKRSDKIGVQVRHKGHWHAKKVWPFFNELAQQEGFEAIPLVPEISTFVEKIASYKAVVCAEGGVSHIARALDIPSVVIYGCFAKPEWNGYKEHFNICNPKE